MRLALKKKFLPPFASRGSTLGNGLTHYWTLDEVSGVRYDSVGTLDLSDQNTVGSASGKHNNAASFIRTNAEYLYNSTTLNALNPIILSFWLNLGIVDPYGTVIGIFQTGDSYFNMTAYNGSGANQYFLQSAVFDGAWVYARRSPGGGVQEIPGFHHIFIEMIPGNRHALYFDNILQDSNVLGTPVIVAPPTYNFRLGSSQIGGGDMEGLLDEFAVWDRELTSDERTELWNAGAGKFYPF